MIFVKVIRVGNPIKEVALDDNASVSAGLTAAEFSLSDGEGVTVNGTPVDLDSTLKDGDRIILAKGAKSAH